MVHAGSLYWLETHTAQSAGTRRDWLYTMPERGGTPRLLAQLVEAHSNLSVGPRAVYVADGDPAKPTTCFSGCLCQPGDTLCEALTDYQGFRLMRIALSKRSVPVEIAHADSILGAIAVHRGFVYFATTTLWRVPEWGGQVHDVARLGDWGWDFAFAGSSAAVSTDEGLVLVDLRRGSTTRPRSAPSPMVATDGRALYWIAAGELSVRGRDGKRTLLHLPVEPADDDASYDVGGLTVGARYVYFIEQLPAVTLAIAVPKHGGHARVLACEPGGIDSLAVDEHGVYFIDEASGAILRVPLPR